VLDAGGDEGTAVRTVLSWSYRQLDPSAARALRLVALHPGADFDIYAAAALTGSDLIRARRMMDRLARAYLVHPASPERYELHDLLRGFARELAEARTTRRPALRARRALRPLPVRLVAPRWTCCSPSRPPAARSSAPPRRRSRRCTAWRRRGPGSTASGPT
jgi:hypothetical protein